VLATRTAAGRVALLLWHYHDDDVAGPDARVTLDVAHVAPAAAGRLWRVDARHANAFGAWQAMGAPARPTPAQVATLTRAARLTPEALRLTGGRLTLIVPRQGVVLVEL
jgi:xylan 1,4-beta-xylosidase